MTTLDTDSSQVLHNYSEKENKARRDSTEYILIVNVCWTTRRNDTRSDASLSLLSLLSFSSTAPPPPPSHWDGRNVNVLKATRNFSINFSWSREHASLMSPSPSLTSLSFVYALFDKQFCPRPTLVAISSRPVLLARSRSSLLITIPNITLSGDEWLDPFSLHLVEERPRARFIEHSGIAVIYKHKVLKCTPMHRNIALVEIHKLNTL